jgi:antirestriction protein ArdC
MFKVTESKEAISEILAQALLKNKIPWRGNYGFPCNVITKTKYDCVNTLLLNLAADHYDWKSPLWGTYTQWLSQGFSPKPRPKHVKPGEWAQEIVLYNPRIGGTMELSRWSLFNSNQIEGFLSPASAKVNFNAAESIIRATNAHIDFRQGDEAAYYYSADTIIFPLKEQFVYGPGGLPAYYHSLFHELAHWSETRMNWTGTLEVRELRADIVADYICTELHIPPIGIEKRANHRKFMPAWVDMFRQDPDLIFRVTLAADKATDYIMSGRTYGIN